MKLTLGLLLVVCFASAHSSHHQQHRSKRARGHLTLQLLNDPQASRDTSFLSSLDKQFVADAATHWDHFKHRFNRTYHTVEQERDRFMVFLHNLHFIEQHNTRHHQGLESHEVEINHLADLTPEEYRSLNGFKREYGDSLAKSHASTWLPLNQLISVPDSMDWREHGYVTPVKNQGMCGSCWSFSTTGALEGQHFRKTGKLVSLSEQNLVDCSTSFGNHGCNGGLMDQAFQYVKENGGIDTEQAYPYEAQDDTCRFQRTEIGAKDTGFMDVTSGDEDALKQALATVGPVSIAIDASHRSFQFYKAGKVYVEPECSPQQLDHGVLAVGYGTKEGQDYWIVKNSWGPKWGDQGYIWMARNKQNQCGVATAASYPLV